MRCELHMVTVSQGLNYAHRAGGEGARVFFDFGTQFDLRTFKLDQNW